LRSLENLPHGNVVVAGDEVPAWTRNVLNVVRDRDHSRYEDAEGNVLAGLVLCSGWAYVSHDDCFVMRPVDLVAPAHRGALEAFRGGTDYYRRAKATVRWLESRGLPTRNWNVHQPFLVSAAIYRDISTGCERSTAGFRNSVYGNVMGLRAPLVDDPKITGTGVKPKEVWPVWSCSDSAFRRGWIGREVRMRFDAPGRYER
jgi:hypothetical protein